jgi:hypothetical protein
LTPGDPGRWLINDRISNPSYAFDTPTGRRGASRRDFLSRLLLFWRSDGRKVCVARHLLNAASGKEEDQGGQNDNATDNEPDCALGSVVISHYALRLKGDNVERGIPVPNPALAVDAQCYRGVPPEHQPPYRCRKLKTPLSLGGLVF